MAVKSVIDVEVNDEAFQDFAKLFEKYQAALGATPGQWAKAEAATAGTALNVENLVAALLTHEAINRKIARQEEEKRKAIEQQNRELAKSQIHYREIGRSIFSTFATVAKWASYGGVAGGLLGFGGLLGVDRLALSVGDGRRTAQGLGASYGEAKAFTNSYGRLVDASVLLAGTNESLTDVSKRASLYGAGLTEKDLASGDSAIVGNKLLASVKKLVDATPLSQLGNLSAARGLGQFGFTDESLRRLKATPPEELAKIQAGYGGKVSQFNVEDAVARKWQDLGVQLDAAKMKIESVLVKGLEPLAKPLAELSDSVATALRLFLTGLNPNTIKDFGKGIEDFGKYLGSPQFRTDVKDFADDVSYAAKKMVSALKFLNLIPDKNDPGASTPGDRVKGAAALGIGGGIAGGVVGGFLGGPGGAVIGAKIGSWLGGTAGAILPNGVRVLGERAYAVGSPNWTNPGNIRAPGGSGFLRFHDAEAGVRAIARQIGLYEKRDHLDTIAKIVGKYAPAADHNDVKAYVDDVSKYTGIKANQKLDPNDVGQIAKIVAGITKHEGRRKYSAAEVKVIIQNNTGGSAVAQSQQAAKQG